MVLNVRLHFGINDVQDPDFSFSTHQIGTFRVNSHGRLQSPV